MKKTIFGVEIRNRFGPRKNTNNLPLVSIIIPTYNRPELLKRALTSIMNQTYSNYEIIIIDDGDGKTSSCVVRQFPTDKVNYIKMEHHSGASVARNRGIQIAKGEFISFLDDDDEYLPNFIGDLLSALLNSPQSHMAIGKTLVRIKEGEQWQVPEIPLSDGLLKDIVPLPCTIPINSFLYKKSVIEGFDESLPCYQDVDFNLKLAEKNLLFTFLDSLVAVYHHNQDRERITSLKLEIVEAGEALMLKHQNFLSEWPVFYVRLLLNQIGKSFRSGRFWNSFFLLRKMLPCKFSLLKHWFIFVTFLFIRLAKNIYYLLTIRSS